MRGAWYDKLMNRKGFAPVIVIGIVAALVVVGAIGYFVWKNSATPSAQLPIQQNQTISSQTSTTVQPSVSQNNPISTNPAVSTQSLSTGKVTLSTTIGAITLSLSAKDQTQSIAQGFCGADDGATEYTGDFHLISKIGNNPISNIDLGQTFFTANRPHDGIRQIMIDGNQLIAIYSYGGCANEGVRFFSLTANGTLKIIPFDSGNGSTSTVTESTPPDGSISSIVQGDYSDWVFCGYDNVIGLNICHAYSYEPLNVAGAEFMIDAGNAGWAGPTSNPQPADLARLAVVEFISNLDQGRCAKGASSNTCLLYDSIQNVSSSDPNLFNFSVDFYQGFGTSASDTQVVFTVQQSAEAVVNEIVRHYTVLNANPSFYSTLKGQSGPDTATSTVDSQ